MIPANVKLCPIYPGCIINMSAYDFWKGQGIIAAPFGAEIAAAVRIPFPAHRHSVVAAHRRVAAERDNNTDLGP
jgi:hypothetical protein